MGSVYFLTPCNSGVCIYCSDMGNEHRCGLGRSEEWRKQYARPWLFVSPRTGTCSPLTRRMRRSGWRTVNLPPVKLRKSCNSVVCILLWHGNWAPMRPGAVGRVKETICLLLIICKSSDRQPFPVDTQDETKRTSFVNLPVVGLRKSPDSFRPMIEC